MASLFPILKQHLEEDYETRLLALILHQILCQQTSLKEICKLHAKEAERNGGSVIWCRELKENNNSLLILVCILRKLAMIMLGIVHCYN